MKLSRRSALVATGLGLIGPRVLAQTDAGVSRETVSKHLSALDNYVDETLKRTGVPGLSVAIVYEDQVVYLKGFGVRQAGKSEPVDPEHGLPTRVRVEATRFDGSCRARR